MASPRRGPTSKALPATRQPSVVRVRRVISVGASAAAGILVLFHAWIFWKHLMSGVLADPVKGVSWAVGLALFTLMIALRRAGVPLLRGRRALAVWVMVALLHVGALKPAQPAIAEFGGAVDQALSLLTLPPSVATLAMLASLLLALAAFRARSRPAHARGVHYARPNAAAVPACRYIHAPLPSRAPPAPAC